MDDITIARAVHVLAALLWSGDVVFVTLVVMPSIDGSNPPEERLSVLHRLKERFTLQMRSGSRSLEAAASGLSVAPRCGSGSLISTVGGCMP